MNSQGYELRNELSRSPSGEEQPKLGYFLRDQAEFGRKPHEIQPEQSSEPKLFDLDLHFDLF